MKKLILTEQQYKLLIEYHGVPNNLNQLTEYVVEKLRTKIKKIFYTVHNNNFQSNKELENYINYNPDMFLFKIKKNYQDLYKFIYNYMLASKIIITNDEFKQFNLNTIGNTTIKLSDKLNETYGNFQHNNCYLKDNIIFDAVIEININIIFENSIFNTMQHELHHLFEFALFTQKYGIENAKQMIDDELKQMSNGQDYIINKPKHPKDIVETIKNIIYIFNKSENNARISGLAAELKQIKSNEPNITINEIEDYSETYQYIKYNIFNYMNYICNNIEKNKDGIVDAIYYYVMKNGNKNTPFPKINKDYQKFQALLLYNLTKIKQNFIKKVNKILYDYI